MDLDPVFMPRISGLTLSNFKGIGSTPVRVPMRPITLLFGQNSAGKSTIIHALLYAREIILRRNVNPRRAILGGSNLDLGGFANLIHKGDLSRQMTIRVEIAGPALRLSELARQVDPVDDDEASAIAALNVDKLLEGKRYSAFVEMTIGQDKAQRVRLTALTTGVNDCWICRCDNAPGGISVNRDHPLVKTAMERAPIFANDAKGNGFNPVVCGDGDLLHPVIPDDRPDYSVVDAESPSDWSGYEAPLSYFFDQVYFGPIARLREVLQSVRYTGPLREPPSRGAPPILDDADLNWATGNAAWSCLVSPRLNQIPVMPEMSDVKDAGKAFAQMCDGTFEVRDDDLLRRVNGVFSAIGLPYALKGVRRRALCQDHPLWNALAKAARDDGSGGMLATDAKSLLASLETTPVVRDFTLVDRRTGAEVHPQDVGAGIAQVIPVIVGCIVPPVTLYAIEQPELHLHPGMQSTLADLFALVAHLRDGRSVLLETHSEHLILRLLRRIRECGGKPTPEQPFGLSPDDVCVLYADQEAGGVVLTEIQIDGRGEFMKQWPHGFFQEREEDLFG